MSSLPLFWHIFLPVICVVSPLNGRASCDEQWREGLKLIRSRSDINGSQVSGNAYQNESTVPPTILHAALKDHWLDHYKKKLLMDLNMESAPAPGSRRLPKSIRHQLEMIKAREGEPLEQFDECPTSTLNTKSEHVRDVIAQWSRAPASGRRSSSWSMVNSKAKPVKRVFTSTSNTPDHRFVEDPKRSYFPLNGIQNSEITNATLYLFVQRPSGIGDRVTETEQLHVYIYKYFNDSYVLLEPVVFRKFEYQYPRITIDHDPRVLGEMHGRPVASSSTFAHSRRFFFKFVPFQNSYEIGIWISIDLTPLVNQWTQSPSTNFGVMIKAELNGRDILNRTLNHDNRTNTILLSVDVEEGPIGAGSLPATPVEEATCHTEDPDAKCCRYPLEINFEAFGWDWVIAPKRYNAYYCAGTCPVNYKQMSAHAHLMQQLDFISDSHPRSLGPCCTPQDYQDVKIIYIAHDRSIKETMIPGAIVLRCGCA